EQQRHVALLLAHPRARGGVGALEGARGAVVVERLAVRVERRRGVARRLALALEPAAAARLHHQLLVLERTQGGGEVGALLLRERRERSRPERAPAHR